MTSIGIPHDHRGTATRPDTHAGLQWLLLVSGVLALLVYAAMDVIAAMQYPGYSMADQAISELSAIGAPTRDFWSALSPVFGVLLLAFSIGVLRAASGNRALRITGAVLLAFSLTGVLWWFAPMHQRGAEMTWTDVMHIVLSVASVIFMLLFIGFGAAALGRWFRLYSIASILAVLVGASVTFAWAERIAAQEPTPWLGVVERVMIYAYLLWIAVLAVALVRRGRDRVRARADGQRR